MAIASVGNGNAAVEVPLAIQRFLEGIQTGNWDGIEGCYTPRALYDAAEPGWHYQYEGPARIAQKLKEWTARHPWRFIELHCTPTTEGFVIDFEARGRVADDADHAFPEEGVRLANIFRFEGEQIAEHRVYSCGNYDAADLRRIATEAPKVVRAAALSETLSEKF